MTIGQPRVQGQTVLIVDKRCRNPRRATIRPSAMIALGWLMIQEKRRRQIQAWPGRHLLAASASLVAIAVGLAISIGAIFATMSGPLMIAFCALWALAAGISGARVHSWWWVMGFPAAMMGLVLLWDLAFGRESWWSLYVFMLGVVYAVAAMVGAMAGVWRGRQRATTAACRREAPRLPE